MHGTQWTSMMTPNQMYNLMVTLHIAVSVSAVGIVSCVFFIARAAKRIANSVDNLKTEFAPFRIMAQLTYDDLLLRKPELKGVLEAATTLKGGHEKAKGMAISL